MTEFDAQDWVKAQVDRETFERLKRFVVLVVAENQQQNLISPTTVGAIWDRHVVDSLQLMLVAGGSTGRWMDIGTGGGFPGMVLAIAGCSPMLMVEPRRKRAEFLERCADELVLPWASVAAQKVENVEWQADVITARAVASVEKLLLSASHCAIAKTRWLLPRGTLNEAEVAIVARQHRMVFHVEQSLTQPDSSILILEPRA